MRAFDYSELPQGLLTPEIIKQLAAIHEYKGKQELYLEANADILTTLSDVAKIQSIDASNRIEGIFTSDRRLAELIAEKTTPKNRNEEEIAGYRDVLTTIHESYDYLEPTPSVILQLHRDMYRFTSASHAGTWKNNDNIIVEIDERGDQRVRFRPIPWIATPAAMEALCGAYKQALSKDRYDTLILACVYIFDFICIHPFNDGNGRMSRLLTLLVLYRSGYHVCKYISLEKLIEQSKETYYDALQASSDGWSEGTSDYAPFVRYLLGIILVAYTEFSDRVEGLVVGKMSKAQRVERIFSGSLGKVTKRDILEKCPDISEVTVERALASLLGEGKIEKVGSGRSTGYIARR